MFNEINIGREFIGLREVADEKGGVEKWEGLEPKSEVIVETEPVTFKWKITKTVIFYSPDVPINHLHWQQELWIVH